jgi:hypothetical protein
MTKTTPKITAKPRNNEERAAAVKASKPKAGLLSEDQLVFLSIIAEVRDLNNNGMTRSEMISLITQMPDYMLNGDETCLLGSDGTKKIIGASKRKKHEKNSQNEGATDHEEIRSPSQVTGSLCRTK